MYMYIYILCIYVICYALYKYCTYKMLPQIDIRDVLPDLKTFG